MSERFRYRAATPEGRILEGVLEAPSRQQALDDLRSQHLHPVSVQPASTGERRAGRFLGRRAAVMSWTRDLATLVGAGLPLDRALTVTTEQSTHDGLADTLAEVRRSVRGGLSLADALARHPGYFPMLVVAMVQAGEASGQLETVLEQTAEHLEETADLRSQVFSALLYPALMATVASLGVAVLLLFVVPRFSAMLEEVGGSLPLTTQLLVGVSGLVTGWWWLWLGLGAVGVVFLRGALQRPEFRSRLDAARLSFPWVGDLERKYFTALFARTLGILLQSGVGIVQALTITRGAIANRLIAESVEGAAVGVSEGSPLAPLLAGTFPRPAIHMIVVGEESGKLEDVCLRVARTYDGEVRRTLRALVSMIEPVMILIFGLLVGFVALAMLQAIYSINATAF